MLEIQYWISTQKWYRKMWLRNSRSTAIFFYIFRLGILLFQFCKDKIRIIKAVMSHIFVENFEYSKVKATSYCHIHTNKFFEWCQVENTISTWILFFLFCCFLENWIFFFMFVSVKILVKKWYYGNWSLTLRCRINWKIEQKLDIDFYLKFYYFFKCFILLPLK